MSCWGFEVSSSQASSAFGGMAEIGFGFVDLCVVGYCIVCKEKFIFDGLFFSLERLLWCHVVMY